VDLLEAILGSRNPVYQQHSTARGAIVAPFALFRISFGLIGFLLRGLSVFLAILVGNYAGDKLRAQITGQSGHQLEFIHQDERGNTFIAANLLLSNFLPALVVALIARPRWLFAFFRWNSCQLFPW
jgi:hypothetical protein